MEPEVHAAASRRLLTERLATEEDPVRRRNLEVVARHVVAEVAADRRLGSMEDVRDFHVNNMRVGRSRLAFDVTRVLVDERTVVTEGVFRHVVEGRFLPGRTLPDGGPLDPQTRYLTAYQSIVVWPISSEGLIEGGEIYLGEPHQVQRAVAPEELPHLGLANGA